MFILSLSDYIAKKSGHERYELFDDEFRQEIYFPEINELDSLKKSVTFNIEELKNFKAFLNINENIGNDFIIEVGDDKFNNFLLIEGCPPKIIFVAEPSKWPHLALIGM